MSTTDESKKLELADLKKRADMIGLKYHPNIGLAKLKDKVNTQLKKDKTQLAEEAKEVSNTSDTPSEPIPGRVQGDYDKPRQFGGAREETPMQRKMRLRKDAVKLIRFRLTCMNPNKKKWTSEMFTVSNSAIGTIKRTIPFNADAWHCENILLKMLQEKKFVEYYEVKGKKGRTVKKRKLSKEFSIEILPPLNKKELAKLAAQQQAARRSEDD